MTKNAALPESDVVALARKYLRARKDVCADIVTREFRDEEEAHDNELVEKTHRQFLRKLKAYQMLLTGEFGEPSEVGKDEHDAIPRNGILEHAVWDINGKSQFLAVSHEDTELPCLIVLGVARGV